jgi:uncharacterized membrane protein YphA (DoxX/SURF4 family)
MHVAVLILLLLLAVVFFVMGCLALAEPVKWHDWLGAAGMYLIAWQLLHIVTVAVNVRGIPSPF